MASFSGGPSVQDASLSTNTALSSSTNGTATQATGIDTEASSLSDFVALTEFLVSAPALNVTQLPNAATMTYSVIASANSNLAGSTTLQANVIVQTGAAGAGAAAATARVRIPSNIGVTGRYVGLTAVGANNQANAAAVSMNLKALF